jgi:beta-glucanase (GH16 family)
VPRTPRTSSRRSPRHLRLFAAAAAAALVAGAVQLLPSAGANEVVIRQFASTDDSGVVDLNRDDIADYARYGVTNLALSVGEQPRDGSDLRLVLPFTVSSAALDAVRGGGSANVSMRVWRVTNLSGRNLVIDAYTDGDLTKADYNRPATRLTTLAPVQGRVALDVTRQIDSMTSPGVLTLRLRLDRLAPNGGGRRTQINVATADAHNEANRPVLSVSSTAVSASSSPPETTPTSAPAPPTRATTTTTAAPPTTPTSPPDPPVAAPSGSVQPPAGVTGGSTWNTIFADDFNGSSVNAANWNVANKSNYGSGNREDECYMAANATVGGGALQLTGKRETVTDCGSNPDGGNNYFFTSGLVTTRAQGGGLKFKFRQGYAEVRMRVPRGNIYWPAFWLVGAGDGSSPGWPDYGEVDVTEIYGSKPDISESNFHRAGGNIGAKNHNVTNLASSSNGININPPNAFVAGGTNSWHTYGINWTANRLDWYIDGVKVRTYNASSAADTAALGYEHSIILNLAMGGSGPRYSDHGYTGIESGGGYNDGNLVADFPGAMQVDYARVWQP